ncbi:MAG: acyl-phosphate glycerol 3-phosphate acyltransferase, partial [Candidatus Cloacimonadota bacterium]
MGYVISFLCGFSLGAIPFGFLVSKETEVNIERLGSGNIGFSNV